MSALVVFLACLACRFFFPSQSLREKYPNTFTDFRGHGTPCIYKSGPEWPYRDNAWGLFREVRPVHHHPIQPTWISIGTQICNSLESQRIAWTSVNPLSYADAGEPEPHCPLVICVGLKPGSLLYEAAVAAATIVESILTSAGFPEVEVAFIESVVTRSSGPKLLSFDEPLFPTLSDTVPNLRKPFTPTLGLAIAPRTSPHYEGTAGLYFRLSKDDDRVAVLTCAHVARPPPVNRDTGMTHESVIQRRQRREEIVVLGNWGFDRAVGAMMATIGGHLLSIDHWIGALSRLGDPVEGEKMQVTEVRKGYLHSILEAKELHSEVTQQYTTLGQRTIGFVLHSTKIESKPYSFTQDWALIELYNDKIDWTTFQGNKLWLAGNLSFIDFVQTLFPRNQDQTDNDYPIDGLLQACDFVPEAEFHSPQHVDTHGKKCLLVVKNGLTTGTTVGRDNGVVRISTEIAVLPFDRDRRQFSDRGDSGSVVLDRKGRIVGLLTGGSGPIGEVDISYITPYWWIQEQIKSEFPDSFLYDVVE
ncbi:hypothetical protein BDW22DRAFT_1405842 [Trametopsis cervina]|nr:hypothetical protein BDW22DRAFT_1405842 [Trametopsis cervina]